MFCVAQLTHACIACPSQWEGKTDDERPFYVRYRWGVLTVQLGAKGTTDGSEGAMVFDDEVGDKMSGRIDWDEVMAATGIQMTSDN